MKNNVRFKQIVKKICVFIPVLLFASVLCSFSQESTPEEPNIVFILAENISTEIGCYGFPSVKTPNIDKLASEGVLYSKAFTTASVCSPSRAAMMVGAYQIKTNTQHLRMNINRHLSHPYRAFTYYLRQAGYYTALGCGYSEKTDMNFTPKEGEFFGFDGKDWSEREEGQPFFAQITLKITDRGEHWYTEDPQIEPNSIKLPPELPEHAVCRDDFARYLSQIQKMDGQVGEILNRLKSEGLIENTIVIWMADNGRDAIRGMDWLYDPGIQVPLIIRWPQKNEEGIVNDDLVCSLDVIATILYAAGIEVPDHMDGNPLFGPHRVKRKYIYAARDRIDEAVDRIRCVRSKRYKYIRNYMPEKGYYEKKYAMDNNPTLQLAKMLFEKGGLTSEQRQHMSLIKPDEELYDLKNDPHEFHNLAKDPKHQKTLATYSKLLDQWIEDTGDAGQYQEKREDALETDWFNYKEVYGK
jgi:N-sulfoglucosamine sulfohydrolase